MAVSVTYKTQLQELNHGLRNLKRSHMLVQPEVKTMCTAIERHNSSVKLGQLTGQSKEQRDQGVQDTKFYYILTRVLVEILNGSDAAQRAHLLKVYQWYQTNKHIVAHAGPKFGRQKRSKTAARQHSVDNLDSSFRRLLGELSGANAPPKKSAEQEFIDLDITDLTREHMPYLYTDHNDTDNFDHHEDHAPVDIKRPHSVAASERGPLQEKRPKSDPLDPLLPRRQPLPLSHLYNPHSKDDPTPAPGGHTEVNAPVKFKVTGRANLTEEVIGEPILDVILEAGDLLYFPRGTIHQGRTLEDDHSLHITFSCHQKNSWADLMERLVPRALEVAIEEDIEFRKSLPKDYLNYMGIAFSDKDCPERQTFLRHIEQLMCKLITSAPVDGACDQMGKRFIEDSLPPVLTEAEKFCSIHGQGERWDASSRSVTNNVELEPDTEVKIIRRGCVRLITEDEKVSVYHNLENARVYHGADTQCMDITPEVAPGVEFLLHSYPEFVTIESLPLDNLEDRIQLVSDLYEAGLIITREPLELSTEEDS